jgi:hypothetical protein
MSEQQITPDQIKMTCTICTRHPHATDDDCTRRNA